MSYNKLVEKLLDFRSLTAEAPDRCRQGPGAAGIGLEVTIADGGSKLEKPNIGTSTDKEAAQPDEQVAVGQGHAVRNDGEEMLEYQSKESRDGISTAVGVVASEVDCVQEGASASTSAHNEGPNSVLHDETESSTETTALREGQIAEDFFRETASQLTYYGLSQLHQEVCECVLRELKAIHCRHCRQGINVVLV